VRYGRNENKKNKAILVSFQAIVSLFLDQKTIFAIKIKVEQQSGIFVHARRVQLTHLAGIA
jgi:hypothetical protein